MFATHKDNQERILPLKNKWSKFHFVLSSIYTISILILSMFCSSSLEFRPVFLWVSSPFILSIFVFLLVRKKVSICRLSLIGLTLVYFTSLIAYVDAFFLQPDAQSGLVFVFIPLYGLVIYFAFVLAAFIISKSKVEPIFNGLKNEDD